MLYVRCVQVIRWEKDKIFIENSMEKEEASKGSIGDLILFYISKLSIGALLWRGTRNMTQGCLDCFEEMKFQKWERNSNPNSPPQPSLHLLGQIRKFRTQVPNRTGPIRNFRPHLPTCSGRTRKFRSPAGSSSPTGQRAFKGAKLSFSGSSDPEPEVPEILIFVC